MTSVEKTTPDAGITYQRRRENLRTLINERTNGNIAAFAEQFGYARSRVSQFLSDTYNDGRSIGERAARAMEEVAGLPFGWLDGGSVQEGAAPAVADESLRARMLELASEVAAAREKATRDAAARERLTTECENLHQEVRKAHHLNRVLEQQVLALFGPAAAPADHGAEVRAAIADARHVFEGQKVAEDVLHYLEQVLAAGATASGAAAREAVMHQARADLAQGAGAPLDETVEEGGVLVCTACGASAPTSTAFDQAAARMAAEQARMVADAERGVAARGVADAWLAKTMLEPIGAALPRPVVSKVVLEVDTSALDAALAKAEQLQVVLSCLRTGA